VVQVEVGGDLDPFGTGQRVPALADEVVQGGQPAGGLRREVARQVVAEDGVDQVGAGHGRTLPTSCSYAATWSPAKTVEAASMKARTAGDR
jgi:hypothetical protein